MGGVMHGSGRLGCGAKKIVEYLSGKLYGVVKKYGGVLMKLSGVEKTKTFLALQCIVVLLLVGMNNISICSAFSVGRSYEINPISDQITDGFYRIKTSDINSCWEIKGDINSPEALDIGLGQMERQNDCQIFFPKNKQERNYSLMIV